MVNGVTVLMDTGAGIMTRLTACTDNGTARVQRDRLIKDQEEYILYFLVVHNDENVFIRFCKKLNFNIHCIL